MPKRHTITPPTTRGAFSHSTSVTIRFCDQDPLGHVNNAAMAAYFEQARVALIYPLIRAKGGPGLELVIARLVIDYLEELSYPGTVEIGSRVARLGTKSLTLAHGIFKDGGERCLATAECILVFFDVARRASVAPPPDLRQALEALA
jgi:acyl-CoA thioester hydrolase